MKRILAMILAFLMALSCAGCGGSGGETDLAEGGDDRAAGTQPDTAAGSGGETDLTEGISARAVDAQPDTAAGIEAATDFGVRLVQNSLEDGENLLISPLSILCALAMTANGAEEQTRAQMEEAFGLSVEELNSYLRWYVASLPQGENYSLRLANSIWLTGDSRFTPEQDFLQINADYYGADIYTAPFDASTRDAINDWVEDKTDGMIEKILDEIPEEALMYLVNALAFEAQWSKMYQEHQVRDGVFTREDGGEQDVEMMYSQEHRYLEDDLATGFIKNYESRSYAFVALLPREGISVGDYIAELTGERLRALLGSEQNTMVKTLMPKFETEYSVELSRVLANMGMTDAFDEDNADFSGLGTSTEGNIFISRVLHKTFISVTEQGTRAGAATVVEMPDATAMPPEEQKEVYLDRPFVYLLIDCENGLPFFIGVMMDVEQ